MRLILYSLFLVGAFALAGCEGTDRPTSYNKGVYGGKADTKLTAEQLEALRHRGGVQRQ